MCNASNTWTTQFPHFHIPLQGCSPLTYLLMDWMTMQCRHISDCICAGVGAGVPGLWVLAFYRLLMGLVLRSHWCACSGPTVRVETLREA